MAVEPVLMLERAGLTNRQEAKARKGPRGPRFQPGSGSLVVSLLKLGEPLDAKVGAAIMVQHGHDDPMVPPQDVAAFAEEMKRVDADWRLHAYPGVMHSFTNPAANDRDFGTVYDADADARSWREMKGFLEEVL